MFSDQDTSTIKQLYKLYIVYVSGQRKSGSACHMTRSANQRRQSIVFFNIILLPNVLL